MAYSSSTTFPNRWLAFELSVLGRLRFSSIALPFSGEPDLSINLKRRGVRVAANDPLLWAYTKATAVVENYSEKLSQDDVDSILDEAYVPFVKLDNPSLLKWFNETDAWWFNNLHSNAEKLESQYQRAIALTAGMMVGDYVLSFDSDTTQLREPLSLSRVFRQMLDILPFPHDNSFRNLSTNQNAHDFVAERRHTDLLFLRLPPPVIQPEPRRSTVLAWREEWLRGGDNFWEEFERQQAGKLGSHVQSKQQYLGFVEDLLRRAAHIPSWAIAHTENGFISGEELVETVSRIRKVEAIYIKDFSDLLGVRASILTASS